LAVLRGDPVRVVAVVAVLAVLTACSPTGDAESPVEASAPALPPDGSFTRPYIGRGVVTEIRDDIIQIDHEAIPGFMTAVTMDFPLADPGMAAPLEPGDPVRFSIQVLDAWSHQIIRIEHVE
jgi:protein SCO1/2